MPEFAVDIGGDATYPWYKLVYARDYKFGHDRVSAILAGWESGLAGGNTIEITRDGVTAAKGKVYDIQGVEDEIIGQLLDGFSLEKKHMDLQVVDREKDDAPEDFITDGLADSDLSAGTLNAYGSDINMRFGSTDVAKWGRMDQVNELCFVTGWEVKVTPAGVVNFKSQCGTDRSATVSFKWGENLLKWYKPFRTNVLDKIGKLYIYGHREGNYLAYGSAGSGTPVRTITRKSLIENDTCGKAAVAIHADMQNDVNWGCFEAIDGYEGLAYDVYDKVHVEDSRYSIDGDYRIYHIDKEVLSGGGERTRIWVTNLTKLTGNGPILLEKDMYMLGLGQTITRDLGRGANSLIADSSVNTSGIVVVGGIVSTIGTPSGAASNWRDKDEGTSYETDALSWEDQWTDALYALDGIKFIIKRFEFQAGGSEDGGAPTAYVRAQFKFGAGAWVTAASDDFSVGGGQAYYWVDSGEITSSNEGANNEILYLRIQSYLSNTNGVVRVKTPRIQVQQKQYRRDHA